MEETVLQLFCDSRFAIQLSYPRIVNGHPIEREEEITAQAVTIRLTSHERKDIYFEISRFANAMMQRLYQEVKERSKQTQELIIGDAIETTLSRRPGLSFVLQRGMLQRMVYLIQVENDVYRLTYNPLHPMNKQILETVVFD